MYGVLRCIRNGGKINPKNLIKTKPRLSKLRFCKC